uniref:Uncharacterized protein n=1 Tax=Setaria italica TaxID=4555 RepID=K3XUG6_SETIT
MQNTIFIPQTTHGSRAATMPPTSDVAPQNNLLSLSTKPKTDRAERKGNITELFRLQKIPDLQN